MTTSPAHHQIGFVTFEPPQFPCGGVAAVAGRLPKYLCRALDQPTCAIAPWFSRSTSLKRLRVNPLTQFTLPVEGHPVSVEILSCQDSETGPVTWYFLRPSAPDLFAGERHPYDLGGHVLRRDALFFGRAVAEALGAIAADKPWTLLLQDWEAATVALALPDQPTGGHTTCWLTLHNSYDCPCSPADLAAVGIKSELCPGPYGSAAATVLERALLLVARPLFTVSQQFALDLVEEHLQVHVLANHLQRFLCGSLLGVDNGLFTECTVERRYLAKASHGDYKMLQNWKLQQRQQLLDTLQDLQSSPATPIWGDPRAFDRHVNSVWFVMGGRDDARQKGYDLAVDAVEQFLGKGGEASFLFFPAPGDESLEGLEFLHQVAERHPNRVLAFPCQFKAGYLAALSGADFCLHPSFYEPFGSANEAVLSGSMPLARATGGLLQQVVPLRAAACHSPSVERRARRWYDTSAAATGLLFREPDHLPATVHDWGLVNATGYLNGAASGNRLISRRQYVLFQSMARELCTGLWDAVTLRLDNPVLYFRMLVAGINHLEQNFSWPRAAGEYARVLASQP